MKRQFLLVGFSPDAREIAQQAILSTPLSVLFAIDVAEAMAYLLNSSIDVIILNRSIPATEENKLSRMTRFFSNAIPMGKADADADWQRVFAAVEQQIDDAKQAQNNSNWLFNGRLSEV